MVGTAETLRVVSSDGARIALPRGASRLADDLRGLGASSAAPLPVPFEHAQLRTYRDAHPIGFRRLGGERAVACARIAMFLRDDAALGAAARAAVGAGVRTDPDRLLAYELARALPPAVRAREIDGADSDAVDADLPWTHRAALQLPRWGGSERSVRGQDDSFPIEPWCAVHQMTRTYAVSRDGRALAVVVSTKVGRADEPRHRAATVSRGPGAAEVFPLTGTHHEGPWFDDQGDPLVAVFGERARSGNYACELLWLRRSGGDVDGAATAGAPEFPAVASDLCPRGRRLAWARAEPDGGGLRVCVRDLRAGGGAAGPEVASAPIRGWERYPYGITWVRWNARGDRVLLFACAGRYVRATVVSFDPDGSFDVRPTWRIPAGRGCPDPPRAGPEASWVFRLDAGESARIVHVDELDGRLRMYDVPGATFPYFRRAWRQASGTDAHLVFAAGWDLGGEGATGDFAAFAAADGVRVVPLRSFRADAPACTRIGGFPDRILARSVDLRESVPIGEVNALGCGILVRSFEFIR